MKAAVCYEFGKPLVIEEVVLDSPQEQEVRIKLSACAICHSDILYMDGGWGGTLPAVYGHEAAGIVAEVGPGVTTTKAGDAVVVTLIRSCGACYFCNQNQSHLCETIFRLDTNGPLHTQDGRPIHQAMRTGAFAEEVVVHESQIVPIPADMPLDSASLLACGVITGYGAVTNTAAIPPHSSVVVIGAGGVGLNSIQASALAGASPLIAIDLLENKLEAAKSFGATHTINGRDEDVVQRVRALTNGRGADYVFVTVGSGKAMNQSLDLIRRGGSVVLVGMPASGVKLTIEAANFVGDNQLVLGSKMGAARLQIDIPKLVDLYQNGRLKLDQLITQRYSLHQINEAVTAVKQGHALRNVIVF
jgi:S-(hydroxymethyl)glutathione dehydrogenase/alcohol dehydrogenase